MAVERVWSAVGGRPSALDQLEVTGSRRVLASVYDVTGLATGATAAVGLAVAELVAARTGASAPRVGVEARRATAAFVAERLFRPDGWQIAGLWDSIGGDHLAADGWVRIHTNYPWHREAALRALDVAPDGDHAAMARAVAGHPAAAVEAAVVAAGGCAAAMRSEAAWVEHPHGRIARSEPALRIGPTTESDHRPLGAAAPGTGALQGITVVDLTRVIAGPVCTRLLAAHGASVTRIDPPGFPEVPALLPETTLGKRRVALDLRSPGGRRQLEGLIGDADVVVHGLRPGALDALGLGRERLRDLRPDLIVASLDAYGWDGPWARRRGFDSLVQMSVGIAHAGAEATGSDRPVPLPAQALDHGAGHLLAAGILLALAERTATGGVRDVATSLVGVANLLTSMPDPEGIHADPPRWGDADVERRTTEWGPARGVPAPTDVAGWPGRWEIPAGPLASG